MSKSKRIDGAPELEVHDDEEILFNESPTLSRWSPHILVGIVTLPLLIGVLVLGYVYLAKRNTRYVVTTDRLVARSGITGESTTEIRMADVRVLVTGASLLERITGKGNITASVGGSGIKFGGIPNYRAIASEIRKQR